jgi:RNA recognition motif-containing protein
MAAFFLARESKEFEMDVKLYVGNLDYSTTEEDLRTLFAQAGTVTSVALIKDRDSGQSKGFAFITMGTQSEAQKAITMFNSFTVKARTLTVNVAKPREERVGIVGSQYGAFGQSGNNGQRGHSQRGGNRRY